MVYITTYYSITMDTFQFMIDSCEANYEPGVIECLENGVDVHANSDYVVRLICKEGHFDLLPLIFKHAEEKNAPFDLDALANVVMKGMDEEKKNKFTSCIVDYSINKNIDKVKEDIIASVSGNDVRFDEANDKPEDITPIEWVAVETPKGEVKVNVIPYEPKVYNSVWSTSPIKVDSPKANVSFEDSDSDDSEDSIYDEPVINQTHQIKSSIPSFNFSTVLPTQSQVLQDVKSSTQIDDVIKKLQDDLKPREPLMKQFDVIGQDFNESIKNLTNVLQNNVEFNETINNLTKILEKDPEFNNAVDLFGKAVKNNDYVISNLTLGNNKIQIGSPVEPKIENVVNDEPKPKIEIPFIEDLTKSKYDEFELTDASVVHHNALKNIMAKIKTGITNNESNGYYSCNMAEHYYEDVKEILEHYKYKVEKFTSRYGEEQIKITW